MGAVVDLVDDLPDLLCHVHPYLAAFGQIPADHAVAVLVASPPPAGVRVGEVRGHAQPVAQPFVVGELGAVVVRDADARAGRQRREHVQLRPDALAGGLVRNDAGHEEPGPPLHLGVQVASHSDDAVGLPMAERAPAVGLRRAFGDGHSAGDREARRPPAAVPVAPPVPSRQAPRPAFPKRPAGVDPSVDGLRAHAHERIVRPQDARPAADGQRRPAAAQPFGHLRPQAVVRQPVGLSWLGSPAVGLALRGPGDVVAAGPWPRLQSFRPVRAVRLVLVGREPCVALDLPADAGRAAAQHRADPAYAGAVAYLDLDDLAFLFRQVRIHFSHRCDIPSDWLSGQSPI